MNMWLIMWRQKFTVILTVHVVTRLGISGKEESRGQLANLGLPGQMVIKMKCVFVCVWMWLPVFIIVNLYL